MQQGITLTWSLHELLATDSHILWYQIIDASYKHALCLHNVMLCAAMQAAATDCRNSRLRMISMQSCICESLTLSMLGHSYLGALAASLQWHTFVHPWTNNSDQLDAPFADGWNFPCALMGLDQYHCIHSTATQSISDSALLLDMHATYSTVTCMYSTVQASCLDTADQSSQCAVSWIRVSCITKHLSRYAKSNGKCFACAC